MIYNAVTAPNPPGKAAPHWIERCLASGNRKRAAIAALAANLAVGGRRVLGIAVVGAGGAIITGAWSAACTLGKS